MSQAQISGWQTPCSGFCGESYGTKVATQLADEIKDSLIAQLEHQSHSFSPQFSKQQTRDYFECKVASTFAHLNKINEYTRTSVLGFIENIISSLSRKEPDTYSKANHTLFKNLTRVIAEQDACDPPMYSSHDMNHGLYVASIMNKIADLDPAFIKNLAQKYNIPEHMVKPLYSLAGLIHDSGYPKLFELKPGCKTVHKSTHAILGAQIFARQVAPPLYQTLTETGIPAKTAQRIIRDIQKSIHYHCADSPDDALAGQNRLQTNWKNAGPLIIAEENYYKVSKYYKSLNDEIESIHAVPLHTKTRTSDLKKAGDALIHVECRFVTAENEPFDTLLRIADNCHIDENRLSEAQKLPFTYGMVKFINDKHNGLFNTENIKTAYENLMRYSKAPITARMTNWAAVSELKPLDWAFRASSLWVENVDLKIKKGNRNTLIIDCHFHKNLPANIPEDEINHQDELKLMQIIRLKDAVKWVGYPVEICCHFPATENRHIDTMESKIIESKVIELKTRIAS